MQVGPVYNSDAGAASPRSLTSAGIRDDFLTLFVEKLQAQNPLDPMDDTAMMSQMAQLASLGEMERMQAAISEMDMNLSFSFAGRLVGREVSVVDFKTGEVMEGVVEKALRSRGQAMISVEGREYLLQAVISIAGRAPEEAS